MAVQIEPGVVQAETIEAPGPTTSSGTTCAARPAQVELAGSASGARPTLLAFLTLGLRRLQTLLGGPRARHRRPGDARLVVDRQGRTVDEWPPPCSGWPARSRIVTSSAAWADYDIPGSPYFVLVEQHGRRWRGRPPAGPACATCCSRLDQSAHARAAAGRAGPGAAHSATPTAAATGAAAVGGRDDLSRIDAELARASIHPGHHSLYGRPTPVDDDEAVGR